VTSGEFTLAEAVRCLGNARFTEAVVEFSDGSHLNFEHTSRQIRRARASAPDTLANTVGRALAQFRLNRRHLQLFFSDGSDAEFRPMEDLDDGTSLGQEGIW